MKREPKPEEILAEEIERRKTPTVEHLDDSSKTYRRTLLLPDVHVPQEDPVTWALAMAAIRDMDPDVWIMGDFLDLEAATSHDPAGDQPPALDEEFAAGRARLLELESILSKLPRSKGREKLYFEGNHEQRLSKTVARLPSGIRGMIPSVRKALSLDVLGWKWIRIPYEESKIETFKLKEQQPVKFGELFVHHGDFYSKHHAYSHLDKYQVSQVYGHSHRAQSVYHATPNGVIHVTGLPTIRRLLAKWRPQPRWTGWVNGFGVIEWVGHRAHVFNVVVRDGACAYGPWRWKVKR